MKYCYNQNIVNRFILNRDPLFIKLHEVMVGVKPIRKTNPFKIWLDTKIELWFTYTTIRASPTSEIEYILIIQEKAALDMVVDIFFCEPLWTDEQMIQSWRKRHKVSMHHLFLLCNEA
ncbi:hypothetical protein D3C76_1588420 [compost metagenome]